MTRLFQIALLISCGLATVSSQQIRFETLTTEDGLPDGVVVCMLKDSQGFLWFGTYNGLARYDGYSFKVFADNRDDSTALWGRIIYSMHQDKNGFIWIATAGGGLNKFDPRTENFAHYVHDSTNATSLGNNFVYAIHEDKQGRLWVGTRAGLDLFDPSQRTFHRIHPSLGENVDHQAVQVTAILEDVSRSGVVWIGTWGDGMIEIDANSNLVKHFHDRTNQAPLPYKNIRFLEYSKTDSNVLWIGTDGGGLVRFNIQEHSFIAYTREGANKRSLSDNHVRSMLQDQSGNFWVGTSGGGLCRFDPTRATFVAYRHEANDPYGLPNNNVLSLLEDEAGVHWIGTRNGVSRFLIEPHRFAIFQNSPNSANSLTDDFLYSLCEDGSGILWIASGKGLNRYDPGTGRFRSYQYDVNDPFSLRNNQVRTIYEDRQGQLWVGNTNGVLHRFDKKSGRSKSMTVVPPRADSECEIRSMLEDSYGNFWVGTRRGLYVVDRQHWTSVPAGIKILQQDSSVEVNINSLYEDSLHVLWIGALPLGLIGYDIKAGTAVHYGLDSTGKGTGLSSREVTYVDSDDKGNLWIATFGGGLNLLQRETNTFTHFTKKDGVPDYLYGFVGDSRGNLWLSSNIGLCKFHPTLKRVRPFNLKDGLPSMEFNARSFVRMGNGVAYFGGTNGMFAFNPDSVADNEHVPPIVITKMEIFRQEFTGDTAINYLKNVILSHDQNFLSFEFAALDFRESRDNVYAYRLEGLDNDWVEAGSRRYVAYPDLHPAKYIFRVRASNSDGYWNHEGTMLGITILPPWWATRLAYTGYVLAFLGLLYVVRRFDRNRDRLKLQAKLEHIEAEKLRAIDNLKSRFFANISHEFRTPLTLIEGPLQRLRSGEYKGDPTEQYDLVLRNSQHMLQLVNQLLDLAKVESGEMKRHMCEQDLAAVVRWIAAAFESAAKRKEIAFVIESADERLVGWFDRDAVEKILTNLLSNAFKFTADGGEVRVQVRHAVSDTLDEVEISVTDTGIGIPPEEIDKVFDRFYQVDASHTRQYGGTGIGLALTKELAELLHGGIRVTSNVGKGSTFTVWFPIGKDHLRPDEIVTDIEEERPVSQPPAFDEGVSDSANEKCELDCYGEAPVVLIVEDNTDMRHYIRTSLNHGYKILESSDGVSAVEKAIEEIPDLIISDVMMPKMDGHELCRVLKHNEKTSHIPIILLTAKAGIENRLEGLETGADDYLVKPFDANELMVRVRNLISLRRALREKFEKTKVLKPGEIAVTSMDDVFLQKAMAVVEKFMGDERFTVEQFSREMNMGRVQLYRKMIALTGQCPRDFVRYLRLHRGKDLLKKGVGTVSEVAYSVGFNSPAYFTKCFHEQFGFPPGNLNGKNGLHKPS